VSAQVLPNHNEIVGQFDDFDAVPNAKRAFAQIDSGTITDFSFGFRQPKYEAHPRHRGVRNIRSAIMMEFSPVSVGSIPGAVATGLREDEMIMAEHSAEEIARLVDANVITAEEGRAMLAQIDGYREHISIRSPEQQRIDDLEARISSLSAPAAPAVLTAPATAPEDALAELNAKVASLELALEQAGTRAAEPEYTVPAVINAEVILEALPDPLKRALVDQNAVLAVAPEGTVFFREEDPDADENAGMIAGAIDAAHKSAQDWLKDTTRDDLPNEVQQALLLLDAAATSTGALLEVLGVEGRAGDSPYHEPANPAGSENMGPTEVSCLECRGTGEANDGKSCPDCGGSGMVAVTRGEGMAIVNPDGTVRCPACLGVGKRANGEECRTCGGKGCLPGNEGDSGSPNARNDVPADGVRFVSAEDRKKMAKTGVAMDNGDFPIPDKGHLNSALGHFSGYSGDKAAAKAHIKKRAKVLGVDLSEGDFDGGSRAEYDGDGDEADTPESSDSTDQQHGDDKKRLQQQAMAKLNKMATKNEKKSVDRKGSHPDLDKTSDAGMPDPVNHTATP
jgi:hypothetical protein